MPIYSLVLQFCTYVSNMKRVFVVIAKCICYCTRLRKPTSDCPSEMHSAILERGVPMNSTILYLFNMKRVFVVILKCICNFRNLTSYCPSEWCIEESGVCQWIPQFCIFLQFCNFAFLQLLHPHPRVSIYAKSSSLLVHLTCEEERTSESQSEPEWTRESLSHQSKR